jgi:hypothetical protein
MFGGASVDADQPVYLIEVHADFVSNGPAIRRPRAADAHARLQSLELTDLGLLDAP